MPLSPATCGNLLIPNFSNPFPHDLTDGERGKRSIERKKKNMLLFSRSGAKLNKAQLGNTIRFDVNEWTNIFLMLCIFSGLSCQRELTSHVSLVSYARVCWHDKPPFHFRCLFVWSPCSLSVPLKQNTGGKTQNSNHFSTNIQGGNRIVCTEEDACLPHTRNKIFLMRAQLARVGVCTRFHRPVYGVSLSACVCVCAR